MSFLRLLVIPISVLYAVAVYLRNLLFDWGILKSKRGALPAIVVGNLSSGGTGKTPHTEYLLRVLLEAGVKPAVLSRGYGRKTSGFILADEKSSAHTIGDEPFQIHTKFPSVPLAVCEDRLHGIRKLKEQSDAELVLLDDAFQHRKLSGDLNILLTTYQKPFWKDFPLPTGSLRDNKRQKRRAQVIITTKCPTDMSEKERSEYTAACRPATGQLLCFSSLEYEEPVQLSGPCMSWSEAKAAIGFSGIANFQLFKQELEKQIPLKNFKSYPDHYIFSQTDTRSLAYECGKFGHPDTVLVTTEKDAMRLKALDELPEVPVFYLPVKVKIQKSESELKAAVRGVIKQ